jgi:quercetin dioxygenase-like cupin family protein
MPSIIKPDDMNETQSETGWFVRTVADTQHLGAPAMVARWWTFKPGTEGPRQRRGKADEILYVVRGSGTAVVDGQMFDLDDESVLWLEEDESYYFIAGENGLEILQGSAPGGEANE